MFSRYKKNSASGAQPVKAPVPAAPVATQPAAQPSAVRRKAKPAAQAGPVDKEKKRKERLGEIKLELHRALLENLNLAALDKVCRQSPCCFLMSSETGRLSTTAQSSPDGEPSEKCAISACLRAISAGLQTAPVGTWCRADTMPSAPACATSSGVTKSFGPNQRQVCFILSSRVEVSPTLYHPASLLTSMEVW